MALTDTVARIASLTNKLSTDTRVLARIKYHVNEICRREWNGFPWSCRGREYHFATKAAVTTGTVSVTNENNLVTFSSAVLTTSEHKGWYFRVTTDNPINWYRVTHVASTTQAYISPAYTGSTAATATYELRKVDYELPSEVDELEWVKLYSNSGFVTITNPTQLNDGSVVMDSGAPMAAVVYESNPIPTTYSTGTVSGTSGQYTLTGSGTSWLANLKPGDVITISSQDYTIYEVLTDTSLTLYNALKQTYNAGTSYSVSRQFAPKLRIKPSADRVYTVCVRARRKYHDLVNDEDSNELLNKYESAVIQSCVELEEIASPDSRAEAQNSRAAVLWMEARSQDRGSHNRRQTKPIFSNRRYNR